MKNFKLITLLTFFTIASTYGQTFYFWGEVGRVGDWSPDPNATTINASEVGSFGGGIGIFQKSKMALELVYKRFREQTLDGIIDGTTAVTMKRRVTFTGVGGRAWNTGGWISLKAGVGYYDVESYGSNNTSFPHLGDESLQYQSNPSDLGYYFGFGLNIPVSRNAFHVYFDFCYYSLDDKSPPEDTNGNHIVSKSLSFGEAAVGVRFLL